MRFSETYKVIVYFRRWLIWTGLTLMTNIVLIGQLVEVCDNAVDDDGDGLIDMNDQDCFCEVFEPISKIPNPSFEETNCCPFSRSQLHCANGWIQASQATTDLIHGCGWPGWPNFQAPKPFPDGDAIVGFRDGRAADNNGNIDYSWKEYAGACLNAPLYASEPYRFEFYIGFVNTTVSPVLDVTLFGTTSCDYLPFGVGDEEFGCPTNSPDWQELGSVRVGWNHGWVKAAIEVTPKEDFHAIAIGPPCRNTGATTSTYYYFDNLVLDDQQNFSWVISSEGHPCNDTYLLMVNEIPGYNYQWYRNGIALPGEKNSTLVPEEEGTYQVLIENPEGCRLSGTFNYSIPVIENSASMILCQGDQYKFGSQTINETGQYVETFRSADGCDSIVLLDVEEKLELFDTTTIKIFKGDKYEINDQVLSKEGSYNLIINDSLGCDVNLNLIIDYYDVYWPNVFSPNGDGHNDLFSIYGGPELRSVKELTIFSRWGGRIFQLQDLNPNGRTGWDGKHQGQNAEPGLYIFRAVLIMSGGEEKALFGSVLII